MTRSLSRILYKIPLWINHKFSFPILLLIISYISYGLLGPWLNFFHDEFSILWFHFRLENISNFFEGNRPLLGLIYSPLISIFGDNSFLWVLFSVFSRWLNAWVVFWLLLEVWPEIKVTAMFSSLLMLVYPGFQAQSSAMIFSIGFLLYSCLLLSFLLCLKALIPNSKNKGLYTLLSLLLSAISLFTSEYFFTLEAARYVLLAFVYKRNKSKNSLKDFSFTTIPYLVLFLTAIFWRLLNQSNETVYPIITLDQLYHAPIPTILWSMKKIVGDIFFGGISSWIMSIFPQHLLSSQSKFVIIIYYLIVAVVFFLLTCFFLFKIKKLDLPQKTNSTEKGIMGLFSLLLASIPFWLTNLPIADKYFYTRWTIPFIFGSSIFLASMIEYTIQKTRVLSIILILLISLGAGTQFLAANAFRQDWDVQKAFFWQIKWRIPDLKKNTVLLTNMLDFEYENSDQISMGINFIFPSKSKETNIPYFLFYLPERVGTSILSQIAPDISLSGKRCYSIFQGNTSQSLIIDFQHPSCLKILIPDIDSQNPNIHPLLREAVYLSERSLIQNSLSDEKSIPVTNIVGKEPSHGWCYYFEKADLAAQFREWSVIPLLFEEAQNQSFNPRDAREWFPFIEGYFYTGDYKQAINLSQNILEETKQYHEMLCNLWDKMGDDIKSPTTEKNNIRLAKQALDC